MSITHTDDGLPRYTINELMVEVNKLTAERDALAEALAQIDMDRMRQNMLRDRYEADGD